MANNTVYPFGQGATIPSGYPIADDMNTDSAQQALSARQGKIIGGKISIYDDMVDDLYGIEDEIETSIDFSSLSLYNISMDSDKFYYFSTTKTYKAYCIPIPDGAEKVVITPGSSAAYIFIAKTQVPVNTYNASVIVNNYMATGCEGYVPYETGGFRARITTAGGAVTINLSTNAKFIYVQKNFNDTTVNMTPESIVFFGTVRRDGRLDTIGNGSDGVFDGISFKKGILDEIGNIIPDNTHLVSNPIPTSSGYYLRVNSPEYKIERVVLYDEGGKCVNMKYFTTIGTSVGKRSYFGRLECVNGYFVRFVLEKAEGMASPQDDIVRQFVLFNDKRIHRIIPENPKFQLFQERLKSLTKVVWKALEKVNSPQLYNGTYFDAGSVNIGVPYSELGEHSKYLGFHVSMRTFLTALQNKRSVMYTENVSGENPSSKYGISYHNYETAAGSYYGTVCSGLTGYALGIPEILTSGLYGEGRISGESVLAKGDTNNKYYIKNGNSWQVCTADDILDLVQPMDLIVNTGHVSLISDIYVDDYGNKKFIVWCEEGRAEVCVAKHLPLNISNFISRLDSYSTGTDGWKLVRYSDWSNLAPVQDDRDIIPMEWFEYQNTPTIDPDICTFAGDYVVFQIGDASDTGNNNKAFLNIHRDGGKYDTLQIFAESADEDEDTPVAEVDISENSGTFIYNSSNIYSDDAADKDDWIIVDLKQLETALTHGKYKARVINSDDSSVKSGFTHFQMVDVNFTVTGTSTSDMVANYSSEEAVPFYMRRERIDGLGASTYQRSIPAGESSSTSIRNWHIGSGYEYVKVLFKADYGVAVKRINVYALFNS